MREAERQVDKGRGADRTDGRPQGSGCRHTDGLGSCPLRPRMWDHGLRRPHTYTPAAVHCDHQPGREFVLEGRARTGPDLVWHYRRESRFLAGIVPRGPHSKSPKHEGGLELSEKIGTNSDFPFHSTRGNPHAATIGNIFRNVVPLLRTYECVVCLFSYSDCQRQGLELIFANNHLISSLRRRADGVQWTLTKSEGKRRWNINIK